MPSYTSYILVCNLTFCGFVGSKALTAGSSILEWKYLSKNDQIRKLQDKHVVRTRNNVPVGNSKGTTAEKIEIKSKNIGRHIGDLMWHSGWYLPLGVTWWAAEQSSSAVCGTWGGDSKCRLEKILLLPLVSQQPAQLNMGAVWSCAFFSALQFILSPVCNGLQASANQWFY